jgi:adenine-specific DNA methylase
MHQKCPNCNKDKTPKQELTREGLAKKLVAELRKDDDIKFLMSEYTEIRQELNEANTQLKKDVKEYVEKRRIELNIVEKKSYFISCLAKIQGRARVIAKAKGPEYVGAISAQSRYRFWLSSFESNFFGRPQAYTNRRLKYPYLRLQLY